ncbi:mediator complex protein-domain-containing protein [Kalaharituber pfeilii]|nr:mediator complex protein-domain-containing protein [Kalaharituber pfeilii]
MDDNIDLTSSSPIQDDEEVNAASLKYLGQSSTYKHLDPAIVLANKGIEELNKIDEDISSLLLSAGLAIKSLTTPTSILSQTDSSAETSTATPPTLQLQLESFKTHASNFHQLLDSIRVKLRRQILLQDQAEILAPLPMGSTTGAAGPGAPGTTGPGGGGFDIGLLNVRTDTVGNDMEVELWEKAKSFVESIERAREAAEVERQLLAGAAGQHLGLRDEDIEMSRPDA